MMTALELRAWAAQLNQDSLVGIDEGGLCFQEIENDRMNGNYLEIGGIWEEIEHAG